MRGVGLNHSETRGLCATFAAFLFVLNVTSRFGALEFAFRSRASRGFSTRPAAGRLFT